MLELYQLPISHYCEKVRWALDYKQLDYQTRNVLPGLHIAKTKKLTPKTSLPILVHDTKIIYESSQIISYLEDIFPEHPLMPDDEALKQSALEWEHYADKEIGVHVRRLCYHSLLEHPDMVIPLFSHNGPWYGSFLLNCIFPKLRNQMRAYMQLNDKAAEVSAKHLEQAIDKVFSHIQENGFFVGHEFTRADLAVASLLAPLCRPEKYGLDWPQSYPEELEKVIEHYADKLIWVNDLYENYRLSSI